MRFVFLAVTAWLMVACRHEATPVPRPHEVTVDGAFHAVQCGGVTAVFSGSAEALTALGPQAPKSFGVESLAFRFADGTQRGFAPTGQLFFSDWTFELFSPGCERVALQVDHYGPLHVVPVAELKRYLAREVAPTVVEAPRSNEALVIGQLRWAAGDTLEFVASGGGGATAFRAKGATVEAVFSAPEAPRGVRRTTTGYEVVP